MRVDVVDAALRGRLRRRTAPAIAQDRADPGRAHVRRGAGRASWPPSRTWPCSAAATRASTSACVEHLADDAVSIGPLRAGGRRAAGDGRRRRGAAQAARARSATPRARSRSRSARRSREPRVPALHAPAALPRAGRCPRSCSRGDHAQGPASGAWSGAASGPQRLRGARRELATIRDLRGPTGTRFFHGLMSTVIESIEQRPAPAEAARPSRAGDRVRVHFQVVEGNRKRTQVFEGIVIKRQGSGARETFTVRKHSFGVGVERTFPLHSPKIEQLEVAARGDVRRAKLYYLRDKVGKQARVAERRWGIEDDLVIAEPAEAEAVDAEGVAGSEAARPRWSTPRPAAGEGDAEASRDGRGRGARTSRGRGSPTAERAGRRGRDAGRGAGAAMSPPRQAAIPKRQKAEPPVPKPRAPRARSSSSSSSSRSPSGWRSGSRPSSSSRTRSPPSRWSRPSTSASGSWSTASSTTSPTRRSATSSSSTRPPGAERGNRRAARAARRSRLPASRPRSRPTSNFIKRIVAGPGRHARGSRTAPRSSTARSGRGGLHQALRPGGECNLPTEITIPADHYFMMGDNRGASDDSRFWGPVPRDWIIGKAFATYWPPKKVGIF